MNDRMEKLSMHQDGEYYASSVAFSREGGEDPMLNARKYLHLLATSFHVGSSHHYLVKDLYEMVESFNVVKLIIEPVEKTT